MHYLKRPLCVLLSLLLICCSLTVAMAETVPAAPQATITELENEDFTFAVNINSPYPTADQQSYYGGWLAEYELSFNKPVTLGTDVTLSLRHEAWGITDWMSAPMDNALAANQVFGIMDFAFNLETEEHYTTYYADLFLNFANVDLGVKFSDEYLEANPNVMANLTIKLTDPETNEAVVLAQYSYGTPEYPSATVSTIQQEGMTFAMNFLIDAPTDEQLAYYADWFADFELTINKDVTFDANGTGDGWLAGQYDEWSPNWVNVPVKPVTIKAGETLKIMEFAAELLGEAGLKLTYKDVYETVKDFDCGIFFDEEFLLANPDVEVTLDLKMYNPEDPTESSVIGDTITVTYNPEQPEFPSAIITETDAEDLTFSMNFTLDQITAAQLAYYSNWYADFELTINKDVVFDANGTGDGWLSGQYDEWSSNWVNVPFEPVTIKAGETLKIMEFAAELMNKPGLKVTFKDIYESVKDFDCGVYFTPEFLLANPDLEVTLELKMYNPENETESHVVGETYLFENDFVAYNAATGEFYGDLNDASMECGANQTVVLLKDLNVSVVYVLEDATLDLNGYSLTAGYVSCFGDIIDSSDDTSGLLIVSKNRLLIQPDNAQLPIYTGTGYRFAEILGFNTGMYNGGFVFQPLFEEDVLELLKSGTATTGVTIQVLVSWTAADGVGTQNFVFKDSLLVNFLNSYTGTQYSSMFSLTLTGTESITDLTYTAQIVSNNVTFSK